MRRLLLLLIGWAVAWAGLRLLPGTGIVPRYLLRDALLLLLPGTILFGWYAPSPPAAARTLYAWPGTGRALFTAGALTALAGAALRAAALPFAAVVWLVGLDILLAGALWPAAVTRHTPAPDAGEERLSRRFVAAALGLAVAAGALLRLWRLGTLPPICTGDECARALALAQGAPAVLPTLDGLLGGLIYFATGDGLLSVRLAGALLGIATLPAVFLLGRQVGGPAAALLVTLLLAVNGAHVAASRAGEPWIALPLLAALGLWAGWRALAADDHRRWAIAGLAVGLLALHAPALLPAWLIWFAAALALAASHRGAPRSQSIFLLAAAVLAAAAPVFLAADATHWSLVAGNWSLITESWSFNTGHWALAALAWVGVATLVRRGHPALFYFAGFAAVLLALALQGGGEAGAWLAPAAWLLAGAAAAAGALLAAAARAGRPLLRLQPAFALLFAVMLAVGLWRVGPLDGGATTVEGPASAALAEAIAAALGEPGNVTAFAPAAVLDDPRVRLAAGPAAGRLLALDPSTTLPFTGDAAGGLLYVFTPDLAPLLDVARQLYPDADLDQVRDDGGSLLFTAFRVPVEALAESRGLRQFLYSGGDFGGADEAQVSTADRALDFGWAAYPPLPGSFSAEWQGSLVAPLPGSYTFAVETGSGALFTLLLDGQLVLDTSAQLITHTLDLPAGVYRLDMRYRPGALPSDLAVLWQPPAGAAAPIPAAALHAHAAPLSGLVGEYTTGAAWDGTRITRRKEWMPGADLALAPPYSVVWQGKLAAVRAGETLLGAVTNGTLVVEVDGRRVLERFAAAESGPAASLGPVEGSIYLEQGWHDLSIRYATGDTTNGAPGLQFYWQPPGAGPQPLPVAALAPTAAPITPADRPLPPPPELADARLGDDTFALTVANGLWNLTVAQPPQALPGLPLAQVAAFGACGSGDGQFAAPHGLAFDLAGETLYVADTGNRRVVALSLADGTTRALPDAYEEPVDVEVAPDGTLLALDALAARIVRYPDPAAPGTPVPLPSSYRPRGLATDSLGMIYVADTGRGRLALIAPDGSEVGEFGGQDSTIAAGQPVDVLPTSSAVWTITPVDGRLWQLNTQGSLGVMAPGDTLDGPHLAKLPNGSFFLSVPNRAAVVYFDAHGRPLGELSYEGAFTLPTGVAVHLDGDTVRLAVADTAACTVSLWEIPAARLPG